ncbi:eukaryotic translation initiation factor 1A-like isoform X1 [Olea europaea subsp. europaea]|uniref:Eukaryotic translation initiation factor 1A-like isoform X1 n=1 Tax=Olea europaea subsp. europaea TaxID=158383 RepID=A0A8S0U940_OLEEU|nr:eukaryotic translation initiation factor 1A-like isoform X1 [Olea europaea subsp. europaea]
MGRSFLAFGILVPFGCKCIELADMIISTLKIDKRDLSLKIDYVSHIEMSLIRISNGSSLQFYLELKHRDICITTFALHINVVSSSNEFLYEVIADGTKNIVDLTRMICTCNQFQKAGVPCQRGLAVAGEKKDQRYNYCSRYNTKETYLAT